MGLLVVMDRNLLVGHQRNYSIHLNQDCTITKDDYAPTYNTNKPTESNITAFKIYNNMFNKFKPAMEITYFKTSLAENKFNVRKTGIILRQAIGQFKNQYCVSNQIPLHDKGLRLDSELNPIKIYYFVHIRYLYPRYNVFYSHFAFF
jgi:hypothetical protein